MKKTYTLQFACAPSKLLKILEAIEDAQGGYIDLHFDVKKATAHAK